MKKHKLAQRSVSFHGHEFSVGLTGNIGYINIRDNNLYPEEDSRNKRMELGHHSMMIPILTRKDLKALRKTIKEVLKHSR